MGNNPLFDGNGKEFPCPNAKRELDGQVIKGCSQLWQLRGLMRVVYGVETMFQCSYSPEFQANENGEVFLLDIAGQWIDDLEDDNRENFLSENPSNVVLQAEKDVAVWLGDRQRSINRYDAKKLSEGRLSLLARVIIEEVIMTRYEQLTEESKAKALSAQDSDMLFRSWKRIIAMYEGILKPDGFRLTGPDVQVLQTAISLEIDAARQRQKQQTAPPAEDQEAKSAGTKAEIITDNRKRLSDQLFEETLLPIIFEKLEKSNSITSKKGLYNQIAEPYEFTGHTVRKRFDEKYRPHTEKLHEALRKYGNEELISQIKNIR